MQLQSIRYIYTYVLIIGICILHFYLFCGQHPLILIYSPLQSCYVYFRLQIEMKQITSKYCTYMFDCTDHYSQIYVQTGENKTDKLVWPLNKVEIDLFTLYYILPYNHYVLWGCEAHIQFGRIKNWTWTRADFSIIKRKFHTIEYPG